MNILNTGRACRYELENEHYFEDFRGIDKLRMMRRRISHFVDVNCLERYGVMIKKFIVHKWDEVAMLEDTTGPAGLTRY